MDTPQHLVDALSKRETQIIPLELMAAAGMLVTYGHLLRGEDLQIFDGSRNHNETCRSRIEKHLEDTVDGRERKSRALQRREDQSTRDFERQDELVTKNDASVAAGTSVASEGELGLTINSDEDIVFQPSPRRDR